MVDKGAALVRRRDSPFRIDLDCLWQIHLADIDKNTPIIFDAVRDCDGHHGYKVTKLLSPTAAQALGDGSPQTVITCVLKLGHRLRCQRCRDRGARDRRLCRGFRLRPGASSARRGAAAPQTSGNTYSTTTEGQRRPIGPVEPCFGQVRRPSVTDLLWIVSNWS